MAMASLLFVIRAIVRGLLNESNILGRCGESAWKREIKEREKEIERTGARGNSPPLYDYVSDRGRIFRGADDVACHAAHDFIATCSYNQHYFGDLYSTGNQHAPRSPRSSGVENIP